MEENKRLSTRSGYCQLCTCVVSMTSAISWPNCVFAVARINFAWYAITFCSYENLQVQNLSGGELQRVALTLCLGKPANVYLIDEPSAYLDSEQRLVAAKVIKRSVKSRVLIWFDLIFLKLSTKSINLRCTGRRPFFFFPAICGQSVAIAASYITLQTCSFYVIWFDWFK